MQMSKAVTFCKEDPLSSRQAIVKGEIMECQAGCDGSHLWLDKVL